MDRTPGGYSNSKTRGSRWAVWTSQGQMDMLFFLAFADFCSSQNQRDLKINLILFEGPGGKLDRETESERKGQKCKVSGNEILLFK